MKLLGVLGDREVSWGGWDGIGVQAVKGKVAQLDVGEGREVVRLLARLVRDGRISVGKEKDGMENMAWREKVGKWIGARLGGWEFDCYAEVEGKEKEKAREDKMELLSDILTLAPFVSPQVLRTKLVQIISRILRATPPYPNTTQLDTHHTTPLNMPETKLKTDTSKEEYERTHANSTWVLGACLSVLAKGNVRDGSGAEGEINMKEWIEVIVDKWAWSGWVMGELVDVLKAR